MLLTATQAAKKLSGLINVLSNLIEAVVNVVTGLVFFNYVIKTFVTLSTSSYPFFTVNSVDRCRYY